MRARWQPRAELRPALREAGGNQPSHQALLGKQGGRVVEQARELSPRPALSEEAWICPCPRGQEPGSDRRRPGGFGRSVAPRWRGLQAWGWAQGGAAGSRVGRGRQGGKRGSGGLGANSGSSGKPTRTVPLRRWGRGVSKYLSLIAACREGGRGRLGTVGIGAVRAEGWGKFPRRGPSPGTQPLPRGNECRCPRVSATPSHHAPSLHNNSLRALTRTDCMREAQVACRAGIFPQLYVTSPSIVCLYYLCGAV